MTSYMVSKEDYYRRMGDGEGWDYLHSWHKGSYKLGKPSLQPNFFLMLNTHAIRRPFLVLQLNQFSVLF